MEWDLLNKPPIFYRVEKKCIFIHFYCVFGDSYVYFGVLRVNIEGFESFFFYQYGVCSRSKKYKFQRKLDIENFRSTCLWSENVNFGVKIKTLYLFESESQTNQNGLTLLSKFLENVVPVQNSVLIKSFVLMEKRSCEDLMS